MKRRKFLVNTISFSALIALHLEAQELSIVSPRIKKSEGCRFSKIILYTADLGEQYEFYHKVLEFPIVSHDKNQFTLKIGESLLQFNEVKDGSAPFYHYAINIPSNKYMKAKKWLSERTPVLFDQVLYFDFWDAHAMYFKDPSGNIGEFIARHTLDNDREGEFGISDLLCISEIGTPVEDPDNLARELKAAYNLDTYGESMFIGDENGMYVVVPVERTWFPENTQEAEVHPIDIYTSDNGKEDFQYKSYPYTIRQQKLQK